MCIGVASKISACSQHKGKRSWHLKLLAVHMLHATAYFVMGLGAKWDKRERKNGRQDRRRIITRGSKYECFEIICARTNINYCMGNDRLQKQWKTNKTSHPSGCPPASCHCILRQGIGCRKEMCQNWKTGRELNWKLIGLHLARNNQICLLGAWKTVGLRECPWIATPREDAKPIPYHNNQVWAARLGWSNELMHKSDFP